MFEAAASTLSKWVFTRSLTSARFVCPDADSCGPLSQPLASVSYEARPAVLCDFVIRSTAVEQQCQNQS